MKKNIVLVTGVGTLALIGAFFLSSGEKSNQQNKSVVPLSTDQPQPVIDSQLDKHASNTNAVELSEQKVVLTADQVASLHARSLEVAGELDALTKDMAQQLEDAEKRKQIENQYKKLVEEQNALAIQLVRANKQSLAVQE